MHLFKVFGKELLSFRNYENCSSKIYINNTVYNLKFKSRYQWIEFLSIVPQ